jgi:hypothetical protein
MSVTYLPAHLEGQSIVLDEPCSLPSHARVFLAVMPDTETVQGTDEYREEWARFSAINLARAYGDDEPEYTEANLIP